MKTLAVVTAAMLIFSAIPASATVWSFDGDNSTMGNVHFSIGDGEFAFAHQGEVFTYKADVPFTSRQLCTEDFETSCLQIPDEKRKMQANLLMPVCDGIGQEQICIDGFSVGNDAENLSQARFVRYLNYDIPPSGGPYNLPESAAQSVWEVEFDGEVLTYLVSVNYSFIYSPNGNWENIGASVSPVRWVPGSFPKLKPSNDGRLSTEISAWMVADCLTGETNGCYKIDYPETKKHISLDLVTEFSNPLWITGRMANSKMDFLDMPGKFQKVTIQGEEVDVYGSGVTLPTERYNQLMNLDLEIRPNSNRGVGYGGSAPQAFEALSIMGPLMGDRALGFNRQWGFMAGLITYTTPCVTSSEGIVGYVTTDAMVYETQAPSFNGGYFSYRVAGLHLDPQNQPILGSYEFGISNDLARCLYGFSNSPISATVSVLGSLGEQKVAPTVVSSRNDWTHLYAKGFTFSENRIDVRVRTIGTSQIRTLSTFSGGSTILSPRQKSEIRAVLAKSSGNAKFICTGIRYFNQPIRENIQVRARAKAACDYAKSLNPNFSYWYQTKTTKARSYNGKVMVVSKG